jgi:hypothetical protein
VRTNPDYVDYGWVRPANSSWLISSAILELRGDTMELTREWLRRHVYFLPRTSVTRLSEENFFWLFFSGSLRIKHKISTYPRLLYLSRDIDVLTVQLRQHGFSVFTSDA